MNAIAAYGTSQTLFTLQSINERHEQLAREAALTRAAHEASRASGQPGVGRRIGRRIAGIVVDVLEALHPQPTDGLVIDDVVPRLRDYPLAA